MDPHSDVYCLVDSRFTITCNDDTKRRGCHNAPGAWGTIWGRCSWRGSPRRAHALTGSQTENTHRRHMLEDSTLSEILQPSRAALGIRTFGRILNSSCIGGSTPQNGLGVREACRVQVGLRHAVGSGSRKKVRSVFYLAQRASMRKADDRDPKLTMGRQGLRTIQELWGGRGAVYMSSSCGHGE